MGEDVSVWGGCGEGVGEVETWGERCFNECTLRAAL